MPAIPAVPFSPEVEMKTLLVSAVAGLLVLGGCRDSSAPNNVIVTTVVGARAFRAGTEVSVTVSVTNLDDRAHGFSLHTCGQEFEVTTLTGDLVGPGLRLCNAITEDGELAPGQQHVFVHRWNGDGRGPDGSDNILLPPGTYLLRGTVHIYGVTWLTKSRPVEIIVTE
jgi:hypothetical protein